MSLFKALFYAHRARIFVSSSSHIFNFFQEMKSTSCVLITASSLGFLNVPVNAFLGRPLSELQNFLNGGKVHGSDCCPAAPSFPPMVLKSFSSLLI